MGSGGQRSVKRRAAGGGATTVAAAATSAASTGGGGAVGRNLSGTETFASLDQKAQESIISNAVKAPQKNSYRHMAQVIRSSSITQGLMESHS